jgi:hypothetical protein
MEFLLKVFTLRNLLLALAAIGLVLAADNLQQYPRRWYHAWRYPPQRDSGSGGRDILEGKERREAAGLRRRYERVMAQLDEARRQGFQVGVLERKAEVALRLNDARDRPHAVKILVEVEMNVPRKKVQYIPLYPADEEVPIPRDIPGRRVKRR